MNNQQSRRNIRAVSGFHYFISCLLLGAGAGSALILAQAGTLNWRRMVAIAGLLGLGIFEFALARGLRRFRPWSRKAGIIVSILGLLVFPIGTVVCAASLYVFLTARWPTPDDLDPEQPASIPS